jgi:hypothetical protein
MFSQAMLMQQGRLTICCRQVLTAARVLAAVGPRAFWVPSTITTRVLVG